MHFTKFYFKKVFFIFLFFTSLKSWGQETIPINPVTGLASVNNVIVLTNKSVPQLKQIAQGFIARYSDNTVLLGQKQNQYKKDKKMPLFSAHETLNQDSALTYRGLMKVFLSHDRPRSSETDTHIISFKINFYFKANKVKYDITNFSHTNLGKENGGQLENEMPDDYRKLKGGRMMWEEIQQLTIKQAKQIASVIEETFKTGADKQLDF